MVLDYLQALTAIGPRLAYDFSFEQWRQEASVIAYLVALSVPPSNPSYRGKSGTKLAPA